MSEFTDLGIYIALFSAALLAATLLPLQSEALLAGLVLHGQHPIATLITIASLGNIIGSIINWWLGRSLHRLKSKPWFQKKLTTLQRAEYWYHRYGRYSLLFSWMPIIGDPLTLIAGILREPLWSFLLIVTLAKTSRYCIVTYFMLEVNGLLSV